MNYGVQLGHRFRALKLWAVMRSFGADGLASVIRQHCALATQFEGWIRSNDQWEVVAPTTLSVVCFRYKASDAVNMAILDRVNCSGRVYLSHTKLHGRVVLRLAIGNARTDERHVGEAWRLLQQEAQQAASNEPAAPARG